MAKNLILAISFGFKLSSNLNSNNYFQEMMNATLLLRQHSWCDIYDSVNCVNETDIITCFLKLKSPQLLLAADVNTLCTKSQDRFILPKSTY